MIVENLNQHVCPKCDTPANVTNKNFSWDNVGDNISGNFVCACKQMALVGNCHIEANEQDIDIDLLSLNEKIALFGDFGWEWEECESV